MRVTHSENLGPRGPWSTSDVQRVSILHSHMVIDDALFFERLDGGSPPPRGIKNIRLQDILGGVKARLHTPRDSAIPSSNVMWRYSLHRDSGGPYIDIAQPDIWRWRAALETPVQPPDRTLFARIRNLPRMKDPLNQWPLYVVFAMIGFAYGGLHCLAWDATFPTVLEALLWRVSSATVASTGVLIAMALPWSLYPPFWSNINFSFKFIRTPFDQADEIISSTGWFENFLNTEQQEREDKETQNLGRLLATLVALFGVLACLWVTALAKLILDLVVPICMVSYALARIYLVVECFINLAYLPDDAFRVALWSQYVPHIM